MKRAIHRLQLILNVINIHWCIHVLAVEIHVPGGLPEVMSGDMRGIQQLVVVTIMLILPEVFYKTSKLSALRLPEDESGANLVIGGK